MLWLSVGGPVLVAVLTAVTLNLLGLSDQPQPGPRPSASGAGKGSKAPFTVTARGEDKAGCTALPRRLTSLKDRAELVSGGDVRGVIRRNRGARADELNVGLTLEGGAKSLTITSIDIEPKAPRPSPPYDGALVCEPSAGEAGKIQTFADMDRPEPVLLAGKGSEKPYFRDKVITLAPGEQVSLSVTFSADEGSREFGLTARYVQGGKVGKLPVPVPEGARYAITGYAERYGAIYWGSPGGTYRLQKGTKP